MVDAANRRRRARPARRGGRGPARAAMVLLLVLIVVVMIALAGFSFAELMLTENKATHLHGDELRLEQAIGSGVEMLKLFCEQPPAKQSEAGGAFNNPTLFRGIPLIPDDRSQRVPTRQLRFSIVAPAGRTRGRSAAFASAWKTNRDACTWPICSAGTSSSRAAAARR